MKARAVLIESVMIFMLIVSTIPIVTPAPDKFPVTMLVYRDGTVEFTSDYAMTGLEPYEGLASFSSSLGLTQVAGGSKLELAMRAVFEDPLLEEISAVVHRFNFGILIYPNATRIALDLSLQLGGEGYTQYIMEAFDTVTITEITANADVNGEIISLKLFLKLKPGQTYTVQDMVNYIAQSPSDIEGVVSGVLAYFGLQLTRFEMTPQVFDANTALLTVYADLQGNLTQIASQYVTGPPTQVVFDPFLILGAFAAVPDELSKITFNLTDAGTFDAAVTLNYKQSYDAMINANRENYLNALEAIANEDPTNGEPWLPLVSVLKPALLTASQAGFSLSVDYANSRMTWSGRFPNMKVGQVSGNTVSLHQFLSSLGPLEPYTEDVNGTPGLRIAIRGVEDAAAYMDIVLPVGTPNPILHNASTAIWEGVYLDQLQDVSFTIRLKDNVLPTITSGVAPGATLSEKRPHLTATLSDNVAVDVSTIMVKVDGVDVTSSATTSATSVSYTPTSDLQDGPHTFYVKVEDTAGNPAELTVSFTVSSGIPMIYLLGGGAVLVVVIGVAAFFLLRKKPSAAQGLTPPPPPPA
jgi:hypothetical protein